MALHTEPLTGGLVTARDPSLLDVGELVAANEAIYRPFNQAISPIGARAQFGDTVGVNITGMRAIPFEADTTATTRLAIAHGTVWQYGTGGAWTTFRSGITTSLRLEAIAFENAYFLSNGFDVPQVFDSTFTLNRHGMNPTNGNAITDLAPGATGGDWEAVGLGFYEYWLTEYDTALDIESACTGPIPDTAIAAPGDTDDVVVLQIEYGNAGYPILHNSTADKWRLYRGLNRVGEITPGLGGSVPDNYQTSFPNGVLIREITIPGGAPAPVTTTDEGIVSDTPYNFLTISVAGSAALDISRDGDPPTWSTGDVFEDSLVVNDINEPSVVRYSFTGKPHSFPSLYFIGFNTKQVDRVTCIRSLDAVCVIGLQSQVWRLNYLPNETDSEFNRGRCREIISANHGIVGPDAACLFTPVEGNSRVAYVSHDGIYSTDGLSTQLLTMDIDWDELVSKANLSSCLLVNVQHLWSLFLYYVPAGGSAPPSRVLHLSYHPQHLKNGYLKVSGPSTFTARAADYANNSSRAFATTTNVQEEDVTQTSGTMAVTTRYIYPEGTALSTETYAERVRILTGPYSGAGTFTAAFKRRKSNQADQTDTSKAYVPSTSENRLINMELHSRGEGLALVINAQADTHYVGFEYNPSSGT